MWRQDITREIRQQKQTHRDARYWNEERQILNQVILVERYESHTSKLHKESQNLKKWHHQFSQESSQSSTREISNNWNQGVKGGFPVD
jgi:hypothetical protein